MLSPVSLQQSVRDVFALQSRIAAIDESDHDESIAVLQELVAHPCAWHLVDLRQAYDVIAAHHREAGRAEEAEAAAQAGREVDAEPAAETCASCGLTPAEADGAIARAAEDAERDQVRGARAVSVSMAWFPPSEWGLATERWPDLLDDLPADHGEYSRRFEGRLKRMHRMRPGFVDHVSPLTVAGIDEWARSRGYDASSPQARSGLAGELRRTGRATPWPPGRNDPCWCQSGRKYKHCCASVPAEPEPDATADSAG